MPDDLQTIYQRRFSGDEVYRSGVWKVLVSDWFSRYIPPDGNVLDLGCGYGDFINSLSVSSRYAMDLNPDSRQYLQPGVKLIQQDCSATWPLQNDSLDLVFSSNFFEHLPTKSTLEAALRQAWRCLRPGGRLIAMGPNIKYVPGAYWDYWDHYLPLTDASMAEGLQLVGFKIEETIPRFLPYTMAGGPHYPLILLRAYLKCPFAWPFLGRQFLVVAAK